MCLSATHSESTRRSSTREDKETLLVNYCAFIRSLILYTGPVKLPNASSFAQGKVAKCWSAHCNWLHVNGLSLSPEQRVRNMLIVRLSLINRQYLAGSLRQEQTTHSVTTSCPCSRALKNTLRSRSRPSVRHLLTEREVPPVQHSPLLFLHT